MSYDRLVRRERWVILTGAGIVTALAWFYLIGLAANMAGMGRAEALAGIGPSWSVRDLVLLFVMWAVMMVAMMLPSATPTILLYGTLARKYRERGSAAAPSALLAAGYLAAWAGFSVGATLVQWALHEAALLSPTMASTSSALGGALFVAGGIYQWTPIKDACLTHCRSPIDFLATNWRKGPLGAVRMGLHHGLYCIGCCWVLMGLLFVGGVMNLLWIAGLAVLILVEKAAPRGEWIGRLVGVMFVGFGGFLLLQP